MKEDEIVRAAGAEILKESGTGAEYVISTDTRTIKQGDLYLPLKGANFDGENFIEDALENGAAGYFTTGGRVYEDARIVLRVKDTLETYLKLANFQRKKINPKVIGITGSSGKTTVKEMVYSVVNQSFNTVKTFLNHNNEIGFCRTVFSMKPETEILIIEMGMRGPGEIELISKYAQPDIAIITNAGTSHIGRLGSLDNIAKAKCEITSYLNPKGAFIALNQDRIKHFVNYKGEKVYFSPENVQILDKRQSYTKFKYKGKEYELNIEGEYNVENSLAAIEAGYLLGMTYDAVKRGLAAYKPIEKRWEVEEIAGYKVINDSYNANPDSMKASVKTFIELYPNPVVVLGDMGELGADEAEYHRAVGRYLCGLNSQNVKFLTVGKLAAEIGKELEIKGIWTKSFNTSQQAALYILDNFNAGNTIFLKASRFMKFEDIIECMKRGKL